MDLEYFPFDVKPFLEKKAQPVFILKDLNPSFRYWVPTSLSPFSFINAKAPSSGVRIPVFAVASDPSAVGLAPASLLFSLGIENALMIVRELEIRQGISSSNIVSASIVISNDCHIVGKKCRAYFGIALGVKNDEN